MCCRHGTGVLVCLVSVLSTWYWCVGVFSECVVDMVLVCLVSVLLTWYWCVGVFSECVVDMVQVCWCV